jgi:hypothetical protein
MMHHARKLLEQYLVARTSMTLIEAQALDDLQLAEHTLANLNIACVSVETAAEIERIEALNYSVPLSELENVLYAINSSVFGEYRRPLELA